MKRHFDRAPNDLEVYPLCFYRKNKALISRGALGTTKHSEVTCLKCRRIHLSRQKDKANIEACLRHFFRGLARLSIGVEGDQP